MQERKVWVEDPTQPEGGSWEYDYAITNVEYTEFERLGITDQPMHEGSNHSAFPANTNILYVGLAAARAAVQAAVAAGGGEVLPGLIFNLKKKVSVLVFDLQHAAVGPAVWPSIPVMLKVHPS